MSSILIRSVLHNGEPTDIFIEGSRIVRIGSPLADAADTIIDGRGYAAIPGLVNAHTHAAMTLFRGAGDDMPLMTWLRNCIWPREARLTDDDVYWGSRLACIEMIRSGTTAFYDMYYRLHAAAAAVDEAGLRAVLSEPCFDHFDPDRAAVTKRNLTERFRNFIPPAHGRIRLAVGPHAIYTVSGPMLQWAHDFTTDHDSLLQIHLAETKAETAISYQRFGTTPVRYLHRLGVLSPRVSLAHVLHLDHDELQMIADSGAQVVHNPASNMKLGSGYRFRYDEMRRAGITVALGTDGCASSNNLDMIEAMKLASLLGKAWRESPEASTCDAMLHAATAAGAAVLDIDAGRIAEGALADLCLVDLRTAAFVPNHNFVSNLVYAANGSCIDTVICDGRILMRHRQIPGEAEVFEQAARCAERLCEQ